MAATGVLFVLISAFNSFPSISNFVNPSNVIESPANFINDCLPVVCLVNLLVLINNTPLSTIVMLPSTSIIVLTSLLFEISRLSDVILPFTLSAVLAATLSTSLLLIETSASLVSKSPATFTILPDAIFLDTITFPDATKSSATSITSPLTTKLSYIALAD